MAKRKLAKQRARRLTHEQLTSRDAQELYVVLDLNRWSHCETNDFGGFRPTQWRSDHGNGHLWTNEEAAIKAAAHVLNSTNANQAFGVFKLVAIAEHAQSPVKVTKVTR